MKVFIFLILMFAFLQDNAQYNRQNRRGYLNNTRPRNYRVNNTYSYGLRNSNNLYSNGYYNQYLPVVRPVYSDNNLYSNGFYNQYPRIYRAPRCIGYRSYYGQRRNIFNQLVSILLREPIYETVPYEQPYYFTNGY